MWYNNYIRIPFAEKGRDEKSCDCWGLVRLIYKKELNIDLPDYLDCYENTLQRDVLSKLINDEKNNKWVVPEQPKEFDVIILNVFNRPMHVGIVTRPGFMIHCSKDINTVHEKYTTMGWKNRVMGFARYERISGSHIPAAI